MWVRLFSAGLLQKSSRSEGAAVSSVAFAMVAAVPTRGVVLGNVSNYLALRIEKSRRSSSSLP